MNGRIENDTRIWKSIENNLIEYPEFLEEWYLNLKAGDVTAASCRDYIMKIRLFLLSISEQSHKRTSEIKADDITPKAVSNFFISIRTKTNPHGEIVPTSDSYKQAMWCAMNNFLNYMSEMEYIPKNYMKLISKPKNNDIERIDANRILLTETDFNKILKAIHMGVGSHRAKERQVLMKQRDLCIVLLFMTTGMRKSALVSINVDDINFDEKTLTIRDKGDKTHTYDLSDNILDTILDWLDDREDILDGEKCDALFISNRKKRMSGEAIYQLIDKYCQAGLGRHISPHKLRAGFCSILYKKTNNIEFVRRTVGHTNVNTTQRYIVTDKKEKKQAMEIMDGILKY